MKARHASAASASPDLQHAGRRWKRLRWRLRRLAAPPTKPSASVRTAEQVLRANLFGEKPEETLRREIFGVAPSEG